MCKYLLTEKDFVTDDIAWEIFNLDEGEHGFDHYDKPIISLYEAQKWLRLKGIDIDVRYNYISKYYFATVCGKNDFFETLREGQFNKTFETYEDALLKAIEHAVKHYKTISKKDK